MTTGRPAVVEITADSRSLGARLREASGKIASFAASSARVVGRYGGASAATLGGPLLNPKFYVGMGKYVRTGALAAGAALVVSAGKVRDFEEGLVRLKINADASGEAIDGVRRSVRAASSATGIGSQQILEGVSRYVDLTGDFAGATKQVMTFARVAQASDSSVADVAQNAAAMGDALKISAEDSEAAFSGMIAQGKAGSVTMKQLATELPGLAPSMAQFKGGTGLHGLRELGAVMQVLNKRYNSASESATAFQSLAVAVQSRAGKLGAAGVKVFDIGPDGVKRPRDLLEIIDDIGKSALAKDPQKLYKVFGRAEAVAALQQVLRLRKEVDELVKVGEDKGAVGRDLATYNESTVGKYNKIKNDAIEAGQGAVVAIATRGAHGYEGLRAGWSGDAAAMYAQEQRLKEDDARQRAKDLPIIMRYAAQGLRISPEQARQVRYAEATLAAQDPATVTPEQRAQLREIQAVDSVGPAPAWLQAAGAFGGLGGALALSADTTQVSKVGVDAEGNRFGVELSQALTQAIKDGFAGIGLTTTVKVGADPVAHAVHTAPGRRRRP